MTKIDVAAVVDEMIALGAVPDGEEAPARVKAAAVQAAFSEMTKRGAVFESVGLLDEGYFLYYEETDFCLRARRA